MVLGPRRRHLATLTRVACVTLFLLALTYGVLGTNSRAHRRDSLDGLHTGREAVSVEDDGTAMVSEVAPPSLPLDPGWLKAGPPPGLRVGVQAMKSRKSGLVGKRKHKTAGVAERGRRSTDQGVVSDLPRRRLPLTYDRERDKYERDEADHGPKWPETHRRGVGLIKFRHGDDHFRRGADDSWRYVEANEIEPARQGPHSLAASMVYSSLEAAVGNEPMITIKGYPKVEANDGANATTVAGNSTAVTNGTLDGDSLAKAKHARKQKEHERIMSLSEDMREREALLAIFRSSSELAAKADEFEANGIHHCRLPGVQCHVAAIKGGTAALGSVKSLILMRAEMKELPWQIRYLTDMVSLSVPMANMEAIPEDIGYLRKLRRLNLRNNNFSTLPTAIGYLRELLNLDLSSNQIESIPPEIGKLRNLRQLILTRNRLTELPKEIGRMRFLTQLIVNENRLVSVPDEIGRLRMLQILDLESNKLDVLPKSVENLKNLRELDVENNRLKELPDGLGDLPHFADIDLEGNLFEVFPRTVTRMKLMKKLRISRNMLSTLPHSIGNLQNVTTLYISENLLTELPFQLYHLKNLEKLDISGNNIGDIGGGVGLTTKEQRDKLDKIDADMRSFREGRRRSGENDVDLAERTSSLHGAFEIERKFSISHFTKLKVLTADNCNIVALPSDFGRLVGLQTLSLADNKISYLPESIGNMQDLEWVSISNNRLQSVPNTIASLKNLAFLNLGNNQLRTVPRGISYMSKLENLIMTGNLVKRLDATRKTLKYLKTADFSFNKIEHIDRTFFSQIPRLHELYLNANNLRELPPDIGTLDRLTVLNLKDNRLTNLPEEIYLLKHVNFLDVDGNQLAEFSEEIRKLRQLRVLSCKKNHLVSLPKKISELPEIIKVEAGYNNITYLSPSMFGEGMHGPRKLAKLYLNNNRLRTIPKEVAHLSNLRTLDVSYNFLSTLPDSLGEMSEPLEALGIEHNRFYESSLPQFLRKRVQELIKDDIQCKAVKYGDSESVLLDPCNCRSQFWGTPPDDCHACPTDGVCENGKLACIEGMMVEDNQCVECPKGGACHTGYYPEPALGFWRESNTSLVFHACPRAGACLGGNNSTCEFAHTGPLCASCIKGYYHSNGGACSECPPIWVSITWLIGINAAGIAFCFWVFLRSGGKITLAKMKIMFGFLQILGSMDKTYEVDFPEGLQKIMRIFSFLNMDILRASSFECLFADDAANYNFYHSLLVTLAVPIGIIFVLYCVYAVVVLWRTWSPSEFFSRSKFKNRMIKLIMLLLMFGYLPVSSKGLAFFKCKHFDAGWFLEADYNLKCFTMEYYLYMGVALAIILFYTIGVPLMIYLVIARNRQRLHSVTVQERYGVLFRSYKDTYFGWELFDMIRRLVLGGVAVYFSTNGRVQVIIAMIICFFFFGMQMKAMPYKEELDNWLANVSQAILFMCLTLGILKDLHVSDEEKSMFTGFMVLCVAVLIIILFIAISLAVVKVTVIARAIWEKLLTNRKFNQAVMKADDWWYKATKPAVQGTLYDPLTGKRFTIEEFKNTLTSDVLGKVADMYDDVNDAVDRAKSAEVDAKKKLGLAEVKRTKDDDFEERSPRKSDDGLF